MIVLVTTQFLYIAPVVHRRQKTNIIFVNKDLCTSSAEESNDKRTAVIVVLSARKNFERRDLVRHTYGTIKSANNVRILAVVFMLGNSDTQAMEEGERNRLHEEINRYGDIVVGDFVDSYRNLTRKSIMAYEWVASYCRQAQFVVKTDDDAVVNAFQLTKELNSWSEADVVSSKIWCQVHENENTIKDATSRFYASPIDFPSGKFTDHCAGLGYITTIGVVDRTVNAISKGFPGRVCTHEDVFMTSVVRLYINSKWNSFYENDEPIELVNQRYKWRSYGLEDGLSDEDHFFRNLVDEPKDYISSDNLNKYRKKYDKKIFYLLQHSDDFIAKYLRLWRIIKKTYSN